jgi:uncharacterized protein YjbI with pentapeptide repeats
MPWNRCPSSVEYAAYTPENVIARFKDALALAASKVVASAPDRYAAMKERLQSETAEPTRRAVAWERHAAWIRQQFHGEPIFSPNVDEVIPLSKVYLRLRCRTNCRHDVEAVDSRDRGYYTTATISRLHETAREWLVTSDARDAIRLVAGGPGSGKSSFARAFAVEQLQDASWRVIFIRLQHMRGTGPLRDRVGTFLKRIHGWSNPSMAEGFHDNPPEWHGESGKKLLLVFDGLDELSADDSVASRLQSQFISDVRNLLSDLNIAGDTARALVLGRTTAIEDERKLADLQIDRVLHVSPIRPLTEEDMGLKQVNCRHDTLREENRVSDPHGIASDDQRKVYWKRWCQAKGRPVSDPPEAITDDRMKDLNVEPLLLHLLINSDYCEANWEKAAENRNLVYRDIFKKIFYRSANKGLPAYRGLDVDDFFDLMETFGLSALRGNGRTGTNDQFLRLRDLYAPEKYDCFTALSGTDLKSVALLTHTQHDIEGAGFEFVHKTFGEYLAARAILGAARRTAEAMKLPRNRSQKDRVALDWAQLFADADLTDAVIRFLKDEALLCPREQALQIREQLEPLLDWVIQHGVPVHNLQDGASPTFRGLTERQRCAETCLLGAVTSLASIEPAAPGLPEEDRWELIRLPAFQEDHLSPLRLLHRIASGGRNGRPAMQLLSRLNVSMALLSRADLSAAKLSGANLSGANLSEAFLREANLSEANLSEANLSGAKLSWANISGANLIEANLSEANLSDVNLSDANLSGANLSGAFLNGANLCKAKLSGANLSGAKLSGANLSEAKLSGANLSEAFLREGNLSGANLSEANLSGADMSGANLSWAEMSGANLSGAKLSGADLRGANLRGASLSGANLSEADLRGANLRRANLCGANLSGATLASADLADCIFGFTSARSTDFSDTKNLSQEQVDAVYGVRSGFGLTSRPNHVTAPGFWHIAPDAQKDTRLLLEAYERDLAAWRETAEGS